MNTITFRPEPEVNTDTIVRPTRLTFYKSHAHPGAISVMAVSDDRYSTIEAGLRLTPEQVESLFYALAPEVGDELFDLGYKAGLAAGGAA